MGPLAVVNVLGQSRPIERVYDDEGYTCPWCGAAAWLGAKCENPACSAGANASADRAWAQQLVRELRTRREARQRARAELMAEHTQQYRERQARELAEAREAGYCTTCYARSGGRKTVRHRPGHDHSRPALSA